VTPLVPVTPVEPVDPLAPVAPIGPPGPGWPLPEHAHATPGVSAIALTVVMMSLRVITSTSLSIDRTWRSLAPALRVRSCAARKTLRTRNRFPGCKADFETSGLGGDPTGVVSVSTGQH